MGYSWSIVGKVVMDDSFRNLKDELHTEYLFNRLYKFLKNNDEEIRQITKYNPLEGKMIESLHKYMKIAILELMSGCEINKSMLLPKEMIVEHYCNTIMLILDWCFFKKENISEKEAFQYVEYLLVSLERKG